VLVAGDPVIVDRISTKADMNQVISEARIHSAK